MPDGMNSLQHIKIRSIASADSVKTDRRMPGEAHRAPIAPDLDHGCSLRIRKTRIRNWVNGLFSILLVVCLWLATPAPVQAAAEPAPSAPAPEPLQELREKAFAATNAGKFDQAEIYWSQILEQLPDNPAVWSNRGNSRVSQNKLEAAIADYNKAAELAPDAPDPYLNRGTAWEGLKQWDKAIADYNRVLQLDPQDAAAYNNRGNAEAGLGQWEQAIADYQHAAELAPDYAFARVNYAIALYQVGQTQESIRTLRNLTRKYPQFADARAALTAALWESGQTGEAESNWVAVVGLDRRYRDLNWVADVRRWSPAMVAALEKFLKLQ